MACWHSSLVRAAGPRSSARPGRASIPISCDHHRSRGPALEPWAHVERRTGVVAILTGHGGRCWGLGLRPGGVVHEVAILTGHGGPVLAPLSSILCAAVPRLRSSPATGGRCWHERPEHVRARVVGVAILTGHGGPVLVVREACGGRAGPRCCDPHRPRGAGAGERLDVLLRRPPSDVAILTDHGGRCWPHHRTRQPQARYGVAILTDHGGPVLADVNRWFGPFHKSCDPHRPRGAGAGSG